MIVHGLCDITKGFAIKYIFANVVEIGTARHTHTHTHALYFCPCTIKKNVRKICSRFIIKSSVISYGIHAIFHK